MLPMKKCRTCDNIFQSKKFGPKISCPRCHGTNIIDASPSEIAFYKKSKK